MKILYILILIFILGTLAQAKNKNESLLKLLNNKSDKSASVESKKIKINSIKPIKNSDINSRSLASAKTKAITKAAQTVKNWITPSSTKALIEKRETLSKVYKKSDQVDALRFQHLKDGDLGRSISYSKAKGALDNKAAQLERDIYRMTPQNVHPMPNTGGWRPTAYNGRLYDPKGYQLGPDQMQDFIGNKANERVLKIGDRMDDYEHGLNNGLTPVQKTQVKKSYDRYQSAEEKLQQNAVPNYMNKYGSKN